MMESWKKSKADHKVTQLFNSVELYIWTYGKCYDLIMERATTRIDLSRPPYVRTHLMRATLYWMHMQILLTNRC